MSLPRWAVLLPLPAAAIAAPAYAVDYLTVGEAQKALFPEADDFIQQNILLTDDQLDSIKRLAHVKQRDKDPEIWVAEKGGAHEGWFVIDEVVGKHEYITYAVAVSPDGHVLGIEVMSYRETHGGEIRQAEWRKNFEGKTLADPFKLDKDVPNISGATLSCRNMTDGVKRVLSMLKVAFGYD